MNNKLLVLAKWLESADLSTVNYDSEHSGQMESAIAHAKVDTMNSIGGMLNEVLGFNEEQIKYELKK